MKAFALRALICFWAGLFFLAYGIKRAEPGFCGLGTAFFFIASTNFQLAARER